MRHPSWSARRTRDVPGQGGGEVVARVEITIAVFALRIRAVVGYGAAIGRNIVQRVGPSVAKLRAESMPCSQTQSGLERIVVGGADTVELVNATVVGKLPSQLAELIDVEHDRKLAALAADIADLPDCHAVAEALFNIQVVVEEIRCPEVLIHRKYVEDRCPAIWIGGDVARYAGCDRIEDAQIRLPGVGAFVGIIKACGGVTGDGRRTSWIVLKTVGVVRRTEVQERIHVDLVIEDADSAAPNQVVPARRLIGEANPWSEIVLVGREDGADTIALNLDTSRGWNEHRQVLGGAVKRTKVVPAQAPIDVQSTRDLPCILHEEIHSIDQDFPLSISYRNRGGLNVAC